MIRIHKGLVLRGLKGLDAAKWRECIELDEGTTAEDFIAEMEASPYEWFIDGCLAPKDDKEGAADEHKEGAAESEHKEGAQ